MKKTFIFIHKHRYGVDNVVIRAKKCPSINDIVKKFEIKYEPELGETIDLEEVSIVNWDKKKK